MSFDPDQEPLEEAARRALELFVEIYRGLESRRVDPGTGREELTRWASGRLGDEGVGLLRALEELAEWVVPQSMGTPHPLYLGLVNSSPLPAAALADLVVSALNNNGGAFHQSPAITVLEEDVVRRFIALFGLPETSSGMVLPGGTFATLQGLLLARTRHFPSWQTEGPGSLPGPPRLYTSQATHFSVAKSGRIMGLGSNSVVAIPITGRGALDVAALDERIAGDRREGAQPFAVAASLGTTGTGAIDPLDEIAELCRHHGLWLHVDACYGGAALLLDELRPLVRGIEKADSIAVDPHKWFFIPITAALVLNRHPEIEHATFAVGDTSYIPSPGRVDALFRGIPTSRRSSGLTVWMALRAHGWSAVRDAVRRNIELTRRLEQLLREGGFTVLPDGRLSVACARWEPEGRSRAETDRLQEKIAADVVASGRAWFSTVRHAGRTWLRFNMLNLYTGEHHVRALADQLLDTASRLAPHPSVVPIPPDSVT